MGLAIETNELSKYYGPIRAVDSVNLRVEPGEIYGLLGLNGAGKTTTIRALLGMVRPTAGAVRLLGQAIGPHGRGPWHQVGYLVEMPAAYPELTVRENLEVARRLQHVSDQQSTSGVIERLGLAAYADRRARSLSTGNHRRLGLARALLHDPELLILDEPVNGLDPAGVVEIRQLLSHLARERGVTIFMSSHALPEVDRLATRIGIIHQGRLIDELGRHRLEDMRSRRLVIQARNLMAARSAVAQAGYSTQAGTDCLIMTETRAVDAPDEVATVLVKAGTPPTKLSVEQENLEDYFLRLTRDRA